MGVCREKLQEGGSTEVAWLPAISSFPKRKEVYTRERLLAVKC